MTVDVPRPSLTPRHRWTLIAMTLVAVLIATGVAIYQRAAPDMRLRADGYTQIGTVQNYDVWAKIDGDQISLDLRDSDVHMCTGGGPFKPIGFALCADLAEGKSAFAAVVPIGHATTIVTGDGAELPATIVQGKGWPYALAVRVADDDSLYGAAFR
jgi:hypothetical protein